MNAYRVGLLYEARAARYLKKRGWRVAARRFRAADGEIDLIALDGDTVVFVEVKARPGKRLGAGVDAVNADKRRRVRRAAEVYLAAKGWQDRCRRFDILEFTRAGVQYMENAF